MQLAKIKGFFTDANAWKRWLRLGIGALAVSGFGYADQLSGSMPTLAKAVRVAAVVSAILVAMWGEPVAVTPVASTREEG